MSVAEAVAPFSPTEAQPFPLSPIGHYHYQRWCFLLELTPLTAVLLVMAAMQFRPVENLTLIFFPAAALCLILELAFSSERIVAAGAPPGVRAHIALSITAYALLTIAAGQALILAVQERMLRGGQPVQAMRLLPPLQTTRSPLWSVPAALSAGPQAE